MSFTQTFGGGTLYSNEPSYLALALTADTELTWPLDSAASVNPAAKIIDVTATGAIHTITLPAADETGPGQTILFNNLSGSTYSFYVVDNAGGAVATVAVGTQWQVYVSGNASAAGTWKAYQMGASTASVNPSDLAGYGITVTGSQLSQSTPVTTFNSTPRTLLTTDRASAMVWTGTGNGTLNLMSTVTAGNNYFVSIRNAGTGTLTIDPSGSETIDGATTLVLQPADSATIVTDGLVWYSVGLGQQAVFAFDYTTISLTGQTSPYTLSGAELNRISYKFTGVLLADMNVVVPSTYQQYWIENATTGAYTLTFSTSGGTPIAINQGARNICYCNGTNIVDADTASLSTPISAADGGTGISSYTTGDMLYASGASTLAKLADVATGNVILSGGVGAIPAWGKVTLTGHVSGVLPVANGGTNISSYAVGDIIYASGATALSKLADVATGNALISGGITTAPAWGKIGIATHVSGLGTGVATALGVNTGSAGAVVLFNGALGIPSSGTLTSCTGLPVSTGISGLGTGVATALAVNVGSAGAFVTFNGALGTPSGGTLTSCTGLPLTTGITGTLGVGNGGTGQTTYTNGQLLIGNTTGNTLAKATLTAGSNITITNGTGTITIAASSSLVETATSLAIGTGSNGTLGNQNVAVGVSAGAGIVSGSTSNVAVGYQTMLATTSTAIGNTVVGALAGTGITQGDSNALFGNAAGQGITTGGSNSIVGSYTGSAALASNVVLSDGAGTRKFWHDNTNAFVLHATTANAANAVLDSGTNALQRSTSARKYKRDFEPMDRERAYALLKAEAWWFRSAVKSDNQAWSWDGFIADDLGEIDPRYVNWSYADDCYEYDKQGNRDLKPGAVPTVPDGVAYDRFVVGHNLIIAELVDRMAIAEKALGL